MCCTGQMGSRCAKKLNWLNLTKWKWLHKFTTRTFCCVKRGSCLCTFAVGCVERKQCFRSDLMLHLLNTQMINTTYFQCILVKFVKRSVGVNVSVSIIIIIIIITWLYHSWSTRTSVVWTVYILFNTVFKLFIAKLSYLLRSM